MLASTGNIGTGPIFPISGKMGPVPIFPRRRLLVEKWIFDLNDMQQLSVQRQKNSAKRACNTLLVTMKQT